MKPVHLILPLLAVVVSASLVGCADMKEKTEKAKGELLSDPYAKPDHRPASPGFHLRVIEPAESLSKRKINMAGGAIPLMEVLSYAFPRSTITARDQGVDLSKTVVMHSHSAPVADVIDSLEAQTGYDIKAAGERVLVSSFETRRWSLVPFASQRKSGSSVVAKAISASADKDAEEPATQSFVETAQNQDSFEQTLLAVEGILGIQRSQPQQEQEGTADSTSTAGAEPQAEFGGFVPVQAESQLVPYVVGIRNEGLIFAGGAPEKIRQVDEYISSLTDTATTQFRLAIKAYDVTLRDSQSHGIDWSAFADIATGSGSGVNLTFEGSAQAGTGGGSGGVWQLGASYASPHRSASAILNFLSQYGRVELLHQPTLTTLNGKMAVLTTGDEFSFVADVTQTTTDNGTVLVTPRLDRMRVGVTLAVTPRKLDDGRILLEVTPTVSSLQGADVYKLSDFEFEAPRTALQELSTTAIARNGETIQLGGLITQKIANSLSGLPIRNTRTNETLNLLFNASEDTVERRELVITITPELVESI